MYAYKIDNQWTLGNLTSRFNNIGGFHLLSDEERATHGFYRCIVVNESYDRLRENRTEVPISWGLDEYIVTATYQIAPKPLSQAKEERRSIFKEKRDEEIALPINNVQVGRLEDRENITGSINRFDELSQDGVIGWIMADNSVSMLTNQNLQDVSNAYSIRKAQVFSKYGLLCAQLEQAQTIDDVLMIDWSNA